MGKTNETMLSMVGLPKAAHHTYYLSLAVALDFILGKQGAYQALQSLIRPWKDLTNRPRSS